MCFKRVCRKRPPESFLFQNLCFIFRSSGEPTKATKGMGRGLDEEEEEAAIALRCEGGEEGGEEAAGSFPPSSFSPPPLPRR